MSGKRRERGSVRGSTPSVWLIAAVLLGVIALAAGVLLALAGRRPYTPEVTGRPALKVDQDYLDYGDVRFNVPVEAAMRVRNVGDQDLVILGEPRVELIEGC